ncbi:MAG: GNAT family N-acetyltransferase, partial [Acetobacteraceae bacterium]
MTYALRQAIRADLPDIVRLVRGLAEYERLAHEFTAGEAEFDAMMFTPDHVAEATLAEIPGRAPVGIALYHRTVNTFKGQVGLFLEDLFVEPDQRGNGIGLALLQHLAQIAIERNYNVIEWRVLNWNEPSIKFYERIGAGKMTDWHVRRLFGPALT